MRQLLARVDDALHERVKAKARLQQCTMNDVVVRALEEATQDLLEEGERLLQVLDAYDLLAPPPKIPASDVPTLEDLLQRNQGSGTALSDALAEERDSYAW